MISQQTYISDVLIRRNMSMTSPISTPTNPYILLYKHGDPFADPTLYRQIDGSFQYATIICPDITYSVNHVSQFMHSPTNHHW